MTRFKVGDTVRADGSFTFDPSIGIIQELHTLYYAIKITSALKENYKRPNGDIWYYSIDKLTKLPGDWDD